jgi:hypothetical protein
MPDVLSRAMHRAIHHVQSESSEQKWLAGVRLALKRARLVWIKTVAGHVWLIS